MKYGRELEGYPYDIKAIFTRCLVAGRRVLFGNWLSRFSSHGRLSISAEGQSANDLIRGMILKNEAFLISRYGSYELEATLRGIDVVSQDNCFIKLGKMLIGEGGPFWWDNSIRAGLSWNAGFFPVDDESMNSFSKRVCEDSRQIDLIGRVTPGEKYMSAHFAPKMKAVPFGDLEPFCFENPWSSALKGKKVLVIHPFKDSIEYQYANRQSIFPDSEILPDFDLITYRSVSSFAGNKTSFKTWFHALDAMCEDVSKIDFDIALIGCGAYGLSIGAYIKKKLKKSAIHLGGVLQLLFGIKGRRFEINGEYAQKLYNDSWIRPLESDKVMNTETIEGGCYW